MDDVYEPGESEVQVQGGYEGLYEPDERYEPDEVEQEVEQLREEVNALHVEREAGALLDAHPELADPDNARILVENAASLAEHLGRPELANDPRFWEVVHAATPGAGEQPQFHGVEDALEEAFRPQRGVLPFGPIGS